MAVYEGHCHQMETRAVCPVQLEVTDSIWDEERGKWKIKIDQDGEIIDDECDVLVNASGVLKSAG